MKQVLLMTVLCGGTLLFPVVAQAQHPGRRAATGTARERPVAADSATTVESAKKNADVVDSREFYAKMAASLALDQEEKKEIFFYRCKHIRGETMRRVLEPFLTPGGTMANSDEADIVAVMDVPENVKILKQIAEEMDQPVPQVLVEARIVELTVDSDFEKEVNFAFQQLPDTSEEFVKNISAVIGTPGANPNTTQGALLTLQPWAETDGEDQKLLTLFLRYLQTKGRAKILSAPCLILRRGAEGSIVTGEEVPILTQTVTSGAISTSTEFKSVGVKLRVLPIMVADGKVRLEISPEVSTVTGFTSAGEGLANPTIAVRNARTELTVNDGQLVSIGGLYRSEEREVKRQVPILGSIPILGHLFRGTRRQSVETQLVIFLTIRILDPGDINVGTVRPAATPDAIQSEISRMDRDLKSSGKQLGKGSSD